MFEDYYIDTASVPECFLAADREVEKELKPVFAAMKPREVPMPRIEGCPGALPRVYYTEDYYVKEKQKRQLKKGKEKVKAENELIRLLAKKRHLHHKIGELNPSKKREAKMIANLNIMIRDIDANIYMLKEQNGIDIDDIDMGSKLGMFIGDLKNIVKRFKKKVKKMCKTYPEIISKVATFACSALAVFFTKKVLRI